MNRSVFARNRILNEVKALLLMVTMTVILGLIAYMLFGAIMCLLLFFFMGIAYAFSPKYAPRLIIRFYKAKPLSYMDSPSLERIMRALSSRAGLSNLPALYLIPSDHVAAFSAGDADDSLVAVSEGLFRRLNTSEVQGVIAHEISHIRNNDMRSMWFAMMLSRVTDTLSFIGQILIFINMPLLLFGHVQMAWLPIWLMVFAPVLSYVFQLTLSRVNEYNADLGSAELLGTPDPLISALTKIDQSEGGFIKSLFPGRPRTDDSSIFRTHPPTEERIRRLRELRGTDRPKWYNRNEFFTGHA